MAEPTYYCAKCGSDQVYYSAWHYYNTAGTDEFFADAESVDYCCICDDYTQITDSPPAINNPEGVRGDSYSATGQTETKS